MEGGARVQRRLRDWVRLKLSSVRDPKKAGKQMKKHVLVTMTVGLLTLLVVALAASVALAEVDSDEATPDLLSMSRVRYVREGIPMPIVDALVDGWFMYLGEGEFLTESGRTFFWRDGLFVNRDGTVMDLPASARNHLNALGVHHQPTAQDMAEAVATREETSGTPLAGLLTESDLPPATSAASSWGGAYMHVCSVNGSVTGKTGNQADISIHDRSLGISEYYGVSFIAKNYIYAAGFGFQVSDVVNTNTTWIPNIHSVINGVDHQWSYPTYSFSTAPGGAVTKNVKIAVTSTGEVRPYIDHVCIDWSATQVWPVPPANTTCKTAFEINSDSNTVAPHDPGNHHSNIKTRGSDYSTWS